MKYIIKDFKLYETPHGIQLNDNGHVPIGVYKIADYIIMYYNDVYYKFPINSMLYGIGLICEKLPNKWYYKRHFLVWYLYCMTNNFVDMPTNKLQDYFDYAGIKIEPKNGSVNRIIENIINSILI